MRTSRVVTLASLPLPALPKRLCPASRMCFKLLSTLGKSPALSCKKTSKAFFHLHDQLTPSISAVSCSADATKSPKSILVSLSVPALKLETSSPPLFAHRNPQFTLPSPSQLFEWFHSADCSSPGGPWYIGGGGAGPPGYCCPILA